MSKFSMTVVMTLVTLARATNAVADPVRVVAAPSSVGWGTGSGDDTVFLAGDGFDIEAGLRFLALPAIAGGGCLGTNIRASATPCRPGDLIDESARTPGEVSLREGFAVLDGHDYGDVTLRAALTFTATPAAFPDPIGDQIFLAAPFVFNGLIRGFQNGSEVFSLDLTGTGTTGRSFVRSDDGFHYQMEAPTIYAFEAVSPTPEPASLVLLGIGIVALGAARRKT
jgi:hypothetical protein